MKLREAAAHALRQQASRLDPPPPTRQQAIVRDKLERDAERVFRARLAREITNLTAERDVAIRWLADELDWTDGEVLTRVRELLDMEEARRRA